MSVNQCFDSGSNVMIKETLLNQYEELFSGLEHATPVQRPPRRIPYILQNRLKAKLNKMEKDGVITKATEPTDWVDSLVVVEKPENKNLRVCLDPRNLNHNIKRPLYNMSTLKKVTSKLSEATFFTKLDARSGYW